MTKEKSPRRKSERAQPLDGKQDLIFKDLNDAFFHYLKSGASAADLLVFLKKNGATVSELNKLQDDDRFKGDICEKVQVSLGSSKLQYKDVKKSKSDGDEFFSHKKAKADSSKNSTSSVKVPESKENVDNLKNEHF